MQFLRYYRLLVNTMRLFKNLFVLFVFWFVTNRADAQELQTPQLQIEIQKARSTFDSKKYNTAAGLYKKLYAKIKNEELQNEMLFMVAESYRRANNFKQAFDWYEKLVNTKYPDIHIIYSYGLLLKNFERYEEASRQFGDYLFESPGDKNAQRELDACAKAQQWKAHPKKLTIAELGELNTEFSDYSPFYTNGKLIWASSRKEATGNEIFEWTGQKCSDFFEASKSGNTFGKPSIVKGKVNSNFNEGTGWLDSTASTFYFTQCNGSDGKGINCKIYVSYFQNNQWTEPKILPFCSDSFSVGHPAMSNDGKRMYFASDMPGGFGEKDLYYIPYNPISNSWGNAVNLGPTVNTNEDDMFPYMAPDDTLYFSSKGWPGMGGLDMYKTAESAGTFCKAINLQSPVNSGGDDFGISFVSKRELTSPTDAIAYFCSNRSGGKGDDDLYAISIKPYLFLVKGIVTDKESGQPIANANVTVTDDAGSIIFTIKAADNGTYNAELPLNKTLNIVAQKNGYFASSSMLMSTQNLLTDSTATLNFVLEAIPEQEYEFTLQGIYYDLDKADIRPDAAKVLDSLVLLLNVNPGITIELGSHTDSRAPQDYNLKLSQRRAQSCVDYLMAKGIVKERLTAVGYGETKPVNDCTDEVECTEEQHQENRRTTFRVTSTEYKRKR
jgi:peptidoglycan-associated lipoprotein